MTELIESRQTISDIEEMTIDEVNCVGGAGIKEGAIAFGLGAAIGTATFGPAWGAVAVGSAVALAPCAVFAILALGGVAGYAMLTQKSLNIR